MFELIAFGMGVTNDFEFSWGMVKLILSGFGLSLLVLFLLVIGGKILEALF
jgi:hypothetical protein